jgi:RNA polymerase sigma factor (TIGR02999 family)
MGPITTLLNRASAGDPEASDALLRALYVELRELAARHLSRERRGHTLQPTAVVNEVFLRLFGNEVRAWDSRAHFFGAAATAVRRVLVDHARARGRLKRGGGSGPVVLDQVAASAGDDRSVDVMALDEALERLTEIAPEQARVVELRFFAGLTVEETGRVLDRSPASIARDWRFAKLWLHRELGMGAG